MYFKRDIENNILKWYNSKNKKVLSIDGSRQVGKTETIKHFIDEHSESTNHSTHPYLMHHYSAN